MCQTCNGKGVIHITEGPVIKFHHCYDCSPAERATRRKKFDALYQKVKAKAESEVQMQCI